MSKRIEQDVTRSSPVSIEVNDVTVAAYEGESLATALLAAGVTVLSRDGAGRPHSLYCNMGICFDCMVLIEPAATAEASVPAHMPTRVRACLTPVSAGLRITVPKS